MPEPIPPLRTFLADARDVGEGFELGLEAVLQTRPDLILLPEYHAASPTVYEQFSAVAPTVVMAGINTEGWREHMRFYAEVLGREAEVERF